MTTLPQYFRLFSGIMLLLSLNSPGQVWEFLYEPEPSMGRWVVPANDAGYVSTGTNSDYDEGVTFKIDNQGEMIWAAPHGGFALAQAYDGYIVAGNHDYNVGFLKKIDESGNLLWENTYWGISTLHIRAVILTSDSCIVACGRASTDPHRRIFIMKTDLNGDTLWTKSLFSYEFGVASDLVEYEGYYYITGRYEDPDYIYYQTLIKLSSSGDLIWQKTYPFGWGGYSIALTHDTCLIVVGQSLMVKFDLEGDTIWKRDFLAGRLFAVDVQSDDGFIVSGSRNIGSYARKNLVARVDCYGQTVWWKLYPNGFTQLVADFVSIISTSDDGFVACGYSDYDTAYLHRVIKADSQGNIIVDVYDQPDDDIGPLIYPNPFYDEVTFVFELKHSAHVSLEIFDLQGHLMEVVMDEMVSAGKHSVSWDPVGFTAGLYFYRLMTDDSYLMFSGKLLFGN